MPRRADGCTICLIHRAVLSRASATAVWRVKPLWEEAEGLLAPLSSGAAAWNAWEAQVATWREDPFDPHAVARVRVRPYSMAVVVSYIDNLVQWGDSLFRTDTIESLNEATQLYVMAKEILGERPVELPEREVEEPLSFEQLEARDLPVTTRDH